jgi:hypothetical protein
MGEVTFAREKAARRKDISWSPVVWVAAATAAIVFLWTFVDSDRNG